MRTSTRIGTSNDISITIEDDGNTTLVGVQSYNIQCDMNYTKIPAFGEAQPTDYYINGRTYTITLTKVHLLNTEDLVDGDLNFYNKYNWKDFELIITKSGIDGGREEIQRFRNCYRIECSEDAELDGTPVIDKMIVVSHNMGYEDDDSPYFRRRKMKYGSFEFPYNPFSTEYNSDKKYVEHKFPGLNRNDIEDFGANCAVITCKGYFYGASNENTNGGGAIANWKKLLKEYNKKGVREVYHPIFTGITNGLMTNLQCKMEDQTLIEYSFDILEYNPPTVKKAKTTKSKSKSKSKKKSNKKSGNVKSKKDLKVGDSVYITGNLYKKADGTGGKVGEYNKKKMTVTKIKDSGSHPIHLGSKGWAKVSNLYWSIKDDMLVGTLVGTGTGEGFLNGELVSNNGGTD